MNTAFRKAVAGFLHRHHEVETAPRWTCPECQFESNEHYETHERTCSHYKPEPLTFVDAHDPERGVIAFLKGLESD